MNGQGEKELVFPHFEGWFWVLLFVMKISPGVKFIVFKYYLQGILSERSWPKWVCPKSARILSQLCIISQGPFYLPAP